MPKLSRKSLGEDKIGHLVNDLWAAFALVDSKEDIKILFKDLFTHTEYKMLAKRLAIARSLLKGENYDSIRETLHVTPGTIAHVSNVIALRGDGFKKANLRLNEIEKTKLKKIAKQQDRIERKFRQKSAGETVLPQMIYAGVDAAEKFAKNKIKQGSAKKDLSL